MGEKLFRILHHPMRVFVEEECEILNLNNKPAYFKEKVVIPVDSFIGNGNQDPYIFHQPWMYGYCRNYNMPKNTGKDSVVLFGTYIDNYKNRNKPAFLLDTFFVVNNRYPWLMEHQGLQPSDNFKRDFPYNQHDKFYIDFIAPRVEGKQHPKAHSIFTSQNIELGQAIVANKKFSFIPLKYKDGIYNLFDIYDFFEPCLFEGHHRRRNRLYRVLDEKQIDEIFTMLLRNATHLVLNTTRIGSPVDINYNLQVKYSNAVYGETNQSIIEENCFPKCKFYPEEDDYDD
ncbi:MAG: hypothetical protein ABGX20_18785 [Bacillus sp. (in: firmicutes)]